MVGVRTLNIFQPSAYVKVLEPAQSYLNMLVQSVGRTGEVLDGVGVLGCLCLEMSGGAQSPQSLWCLTSPASCKDKIRAFLALGIRTSGTNGATYSWETARVVLYCGLLADEKPHFCPQLQSKHLPYNLVHRKVPYCIDMNIVIAHSECPKIMLIITWNIPGDLNTFAFYHVPLLMLWEQTKGQIYVKVRLFSEVTPLFPKVGWLAWSSEPDRVCCLCMGYITDVHVRPLESTLCALPGCIHCPCWRMSVQGILVSWCN